MSNSITIFRKYKYGYFLSSIGGALLISFLLWDQSVFYSGLLAMLWIFACSIFFTKLTRDKMNGILALINACRTREFIAAYERILREGVRGEAKDFARLNLATGLITAGDFQGGLNTLMQIQPDFSHRPSGLSAAGAYYSDLATCFLELGDIPRAQSALQSLSAITQYEKLPPEYKALIDTNREMAYAKMRMLQGNYEGLESFFRVYLGQAVTPLARVRCAYRLAEVAHHQGDFATERSWLRIVSENGGDTRFAVKARWLLQAMEQAGIV